MDQQYRRNPEWRGVIDARLCDGSAGVMHFFHRLYTMTNEDVFRRAQDYWLKVTLVMGNVI